MSDFVTAIDLTAVAVFAISGALAAASQKLDILGFILFGTITGIGGGTARDLLLNTDAVFWISDTRYLWVCIVASTATWFLAPQLRSQRTVLLWADAIGLSLFSVLGCAKALELDAPIIVAVVLGMMTATFGSLIRDTLLNLKPVLLGPEIYVTASLVGAVSYAGLNLLPITQGLALPVAIGLAFLLRSAAISFELRLPKFGR
jgi:uncharacterized membrane protein YeiH